MHNIKLVYILNASNNLLEYGAGLILWDPSSLYRYLDHVIVTFCI